MKKWSLVIKIVLLFIILLGFMDMFFSGGILGLGLIGLSLLLLGVVSRSVRDIPTEGDAVLGVVRESRHK